MSVSAEADLDQEVFNDIKHMMGDTFSIVLEKYMREAQTYFKDVDMAFETGDLETVARSMHSLKSASALLGFTRIAELSAQIEHDAASLCNTDVSDSDFPALQNILTDLKPLYLAAESYLQKELQQSKSS